MRLPCLRAGMAPKKQMLPKDVTGGGRGLIHNFFKPPPAPPPLPRGPGRPQKDSEARGRPSLAIPPVPQVAQTASPAARTPRVAPVLEQTPTFVTPAAPQTNAGVVKKEHGQKINWAVNDDLKHLTLQVGNWLSKKGPIIERNQNISLKNYCVLVEIPHETFRKYVCSDVGKRRVLGNAAGLPRLGSLGIR